MGDPASDPSELQLMLQFPLDSFPQSPDMHDSPRQMAALSGRMEAGPVQTVPSAEVRDLRTAS